MKNYLKSFFALLAVAFCFVNYAFAKTNIQADAPTAVNTSQTESLLTATAQVGAVIFADGSDRLMEDVGCNASTVKSVSNFAAERFQNLTSSTLNRKVSADALESSARQSTVNRLRKKLLTRSTGVSNRLFAKRE